MDRDLSRHSQPHDGGVSGIDSGFLKGILGFGFRLHESLESTEVAACAVNDGLSLVGCERLTVAIRRGRRLRVISISGQEKVTRRSESIRRLEKLINKAVVYQQPIVYSGALEEIEPALTEPLSDYLEESRARLVAMIPLTAERRQVRVTEKEEEEPQRERSMPFAMLVAELFGATIPPRAMPQRTRLVADQIQSALAAAELHRRIPFRRTLMKLGDIIGYFRGRRLAIAIVVLLVIVSAICALTFVEAPYRVSCEGTLMPVERSQIFAPLDGKVVKVQVSDGMPVKEGDLLLLLESETLSAELVTAEVAVSERRKLAESLENELSRPRGNLSEEESIRLQGELTRAEIELAGTIATLEVIRRRFSELEVRSTVDGIATAFQIRDRLLNRPVTRGQRLLAVVKPDGPWQLELKIDEYKAGPVISRLQTTQEPLPVQYLLATEVTVTRQAKLEQIAKRADESTQSDRLIVEAIASVPTEETRKFVGAEVFAKIECGDRALGYVLFGDVIDFLRRNLWF